MPRYLATIRHHSIASARSIVIDGTLTAAKRAATAEFGNGFVDHTIVISPVLPDGSADAEYPISWRTIRNRRWTDAGA